MDRSGLYNLSWPVPIFIQTPVKSFQIILNCTTTSNFSPFLSFVSQKTTTMARRLASRDSNGFRAAYNAFSKLYLPMHDAVLQRERADQVKNNLLVRSLGQNQKSKRSGYRRIQLTPTILGLVMLIVSAN